MSKCGKCCGSCGSCGGNTLELTEGELNILRQLGQIPFLPVGRKSDDMTPIYPEDAALILQCLEKRELITIDYDAPLKGFHDATYDACPVKGSFALTARGQQVLELLEIQGLDE
jgi:hypothetical protein